MFGIDEVYKSTWCLILFTHKHKKRQPKRLSFSIKNVAYTFAFATCTVLEFCLPNGLLRAKSTSIGAATKMDE